MKANPRPLVANLVWLLLSALLGGCASSPTQPKALDVLYSNYEKRVLAECSDSAFVARASASAATRNQLLNGVIGVIDHNYGQIEKSLYGHKAWADFTGSVVSTGLGTVATLSGAEGVKTTLSALVTAIDSTKVSFNKDVLQGQSMIAIIATMRKMRAEKLVEIRAAEKLPISGYPLSMGLDDLMEYYQAGTFVGALQGLTEDAAAATKAADIKLKLDKAGTDAVPPKLVPIHTTEIIKTTSHSSGGSGGTGAGATSSGEPPKTPPAQPSGVLQTVP